jgi:RNA polymerase sigma factor (sigma-70 family)
MTGEAGLETVFMANRAALARYLRARFRSESEAEDLLQDLWLKLASIETGPLAEPLAYLYRMAENLALDQRRSSIRRGNREQEWTKGQIDGTLENPVDAHPDAERTLLARDHLARVNQRLDALPPRTAAIFRAVRIDGTAQKEIAIVEGISISAVEKHLQRAYRVIVELQQQLDADSRAPDRLPHEGQKNVD